MGILDSMTAAVNCGTESSGRAAEKLKLKNQINEVNQRRQQLAAQLGASLYDATKGNAELRQDREALFDGIAACDAERASAQAKIDELGAMARAASAAASTFSCAMCGAIIGGGDLFCSGCDAPAEKAKVSSAAAPSGPACASCGAPMGEGDMFCMTCGARAEASSVDKADTRESANMGEGELIGDGDVSANAQGGDE